jgi:CBS domain containing-hemolysin-like protein
MSDDITSLSRPPLFTPETKPVSDLMQELQQSGQVMAVTVDEFGDIAGVVTLTQLVEVVMGPVHEDLPSDEEFFALNERTFLVDGGARLDEVNERLAISLPEGDYETIAGFLLTALGRIPATGDEHRHGGVQLVVARMLGMKIERVRVTLPAPTMPEETEREAG